MAPRPSQPDFARTVAQNHPRMKGWIWAQSGPCLSIAKDEVKKIRRNLAAVGPTGAPPTPATPLWWVLAVLLCPGDTTTAVVEWATALRGSGGDRIRFYMHPDTDPISAFAAWFGAGLADPLTAEVEDFASFHQQFGWDFNKQVYRDASTRREDVLP
jgi:hypothetical protein